MAKVIDFALAGQRIRNRRLPVSQQLMLLDLERGNRVSVSANAAASFPAHLQEAMCRNFGMQSSYIPEDIFPEPAC